MFRRSAVLLFCVFGLTICGPSMSAEPKGAIKLLMSTPASRFDVGMIRLHNWVSSSSISLRKKFGESVSGYANYDFRTNTIRIGVDKHMENADVRKEQCKELLLGLADALFGNLAFPDNEISRTGAAVLLGAWFVSSQEDNSEVIGRALMPDVHLVATVGNLTVTTEMAKKIRGIKQVQCTTPAGYKNVVYIATGEK